MFDFDFVLGWFGVGWVFGVDLFCWFCFIVLVWLFCMFTDLVRCVALLFVVGLCVLLFVCVGVLFNCDSCLFWVLGLFWCLRVESGDLL